jgi:glycosyltransferase involved in cell wall biosynthesis
MTRELFVLIPANTPTGPVKGAYALANALADQCKITLVTINRGCGANAWLDPRIKIICLAELSNNFAVKLIHYLLLLRRAGGHPKVVSLSLCLSADFINIFCRRYALTCCSVRGNLFVNYRHDYGLLGVAVAFFHLFSLRWFDRVVAMNRSMAMQIRRYSGRTARVIGNFIDEPRFNRSNFRENESDPFFFVFVGSLTSRKQPRLLIRALRDLRTRNVTAYVEFVGSGPESSKIEQDIRQFELANLVKCHGFLSDPEAVVSKADVLVLPSISEGISRAAMEALYVGIPCVLRDADGNTELVTDGINGAVFSDESDLPDAMLRAARLSRLNKKRECLLPPDFRQHLAAKKYLELIGIHDER